MAILVLKIVQTELSNPMEYVKIVHKDAKPVQILLIALSVIMAKSYTMINVLQPALMVLSQMRRVLAVLVLKAAFDVHQLILALDVKMDASLTIPVNAMRLAKQEHSQIQ